MPIFEYRCTDCGHDFEVLVRNGEQPQCPQCRTERLEKLFSSPAAHTTGSALPVASGCQSNGPPCGPACGRWPG